MKKNVKIFNNKNTKYLQIYKVNYGNILVKINKRLMTIF